jgi:hypothetical protein
MTALKEPEVPTAPDGSAAPGAGETTDQNKRPPHPGQLVQEWDGSPEEQKAARSRKGYVYAAVVLGAIALVFGVVTLYLLSQDNIDPFWGWGPAILFLYFSCFSFLLRNSQYNSERTKFQEREEVVARLSHFREVADRIDDKLSLDNVTLLNQSMMESYHSITKTQAERSFKNSQRAMLAGLAILLAGAIGAVAAEEPTTKLALASLAGIGSTISGFISKTFLTSHAAAISQLNRFFQQPLVNSYLLNAERISREIKSEQGEALLAEIVLESIATARTVGAPLELPPSGFRRHKEVRAKTAAPAHLSTND